MSRIALSCNVQISSRVLRKLGQKRQHCLVVVCCRRGVRHVVIRRRLGKGKSNSDGRLNEQNVRLIGPRPRIDVESIVLVGNVRSNLLKGSTANAAASGTLKEMKIIQQTSLPFPTQSAQNMTKTPIKHTLDFRDSINYRCASKKMFF